MVITRRENLLRVFRHEMPDWIPITGHVDPYNQPSRNGMSPELTNALARVRWGDESIVIFSRYLGIDIMDWFSHPPYRSKWKGVTIESVQDGDDNITVWHTPKGDLRQVSRQCREDGTSYIVEHMVKDAHDLPVLACIFEDEEFEIDNNRTADLVKRKTLIGDDGIIAFPMPGTPLGQMVRIYAGVETLAYLYADAPGALHNLFTAMEENYLRQYQLAASFDADALIGVDDTSTTTISPAMFEEFCMDYTDRIADVVHKAGKLYFHHSCGLIRDLLDLYRQTRMDAVHAFCIPPLGNVTIAEGREKLGNRITIIATLVQLFGQMDDRDAVARSIRTMFEGAEPGDHFILSLAADPNKTMKETQFVLDECRKYQRIPKNVDTAGGGKPR